MYLCHSENLMPKDTKSLGNNKAPACESRGFVLKKKKVRILTHLLFSLYVRHPYLLYLIRKFTPVLYLFFHTNLSNTNFNFALNVSRILFILKTKNKQ